MSELPPSHPPQGPAPEATWPAVGRIEGLGDFQAQVGAILQAAARTPGLRHMCWVSPDFQGWPVADAPAVAALTDWAHRGGRLTWLLQDDAHLTRRCPRLVRWRRLHDHVVDCRAPDEGVVQTLPTLLLVRDWGVLRVMDTRRWTGRWTRDPRDVHRAGEEIDAILQRSAATFPVTTLGI